MKLVDKVVSTAIAAVLCFGVYIYTVNYDMYDMVGNYNAIGGYSTLGDCLRSEEWIEGSVERWSQSNSPVMQSLYLYLTDASDAEPYAQISNNRSIHVCGLVLSIAAWPLCLFARAGRVDRKRLKELHKK